jgi:predicted metal-dependent HD superfamily phosphohydrolase
MKVKTLFYKERDARVCVEFTNAILSANNIAFDEFKITIKRDEFSESLFVVEYENAE